MYYNISYEISSVVFILLLIAIKYRHFMNQNKMIRQFMTALIFLMCTCLINIIAALGYSSIIKLNDDGMLLVESLYLFLAICTTYMQLEVVVIRFVENSLPIQIINFIFVGLVSLVICLNIYGRFLFEYSHHIFIGHKYFFVIYIVYAIIFLEMGIIIATNRGKVRFRTLILSSSIMIFPILSILIQFLLPRILFSGFGATVAYFVYSFSIEDQYYNEYANSLEKLEKAEKAEKENKEEIYIVNQVKKLFMENVSSDIKKPIDEVINVSKSICEGTDNDEVVELAKKIQDAGAQLDTFVDILIEESDKEFS